MERQHSSEAVLVSPAEVRDGEVGGLRQEPQQSSLLFDGIPRTEDIETSREKADWVHIQVSDGCDDKMDVDEVEKTGTSPAGLSEVEERPWVWGMPKWGWEDERKEVRNGVRLVGMEEVSSRSVWDATSLTRHSKLPGLIDRHAMIDTPSYVLFPWLHGISDDGQKGRDMGAFFG